MNSTKKLGISIIGCGTIHKVHADAAVNSPYARLVSVVDIDKGKAKESALRYGCNYCTDYREVLKDDEVDVVHICTPHYLHSPMAVDAMKSGKHVLVEKPMAISSAEAVRMIQVSEETGKKLGVCFQNRYNTTSLALKKLIESGKTGGIIGAKAFVTWHRNERYYTESGWRGTWEKEGGGVLINQAIHTLDLLQWLMGSIDKIKGSVDTRLLDKVIEVEDTAEATILFKNGSAALFYATNCYAVNSPVEIEIVCENAIIKLQKDLVIKYKNGETERISNLDTVTAGKSYWGNGHMALIQDFYGAIAENRDFCIDGRQGINAVKIIEAIYRSAKTGEYIKFE